MRPRIRRRDLRERAADVHRGKGDAAASGGNAWQSSPENFALSTALRGGSDRGVYAPFAKRPEAAARHARARLAARGRKREPVGGAMAEAPPKVARMAVGQFCPVQK